MDDFPRPPNVVANVQLMFGRAQIGLDGQVPTLIFCLLRTSCDCSQLLARPARV